MKDEMKKEMNPYVEQALACHKKGYNCAQCVACVFADRLGRDEKELFEIMEAFGFGMGMMGTCGAVSGMAAVVGMKESDGNLDKPATKKDSYRVSKELIRRFEEKNGSIICRVIKGVDTKKVLRSCNGCIEDAVELVRAYLDGELDQDLASIVEQEKAKAAAKAAIARQAARGL